MARVRSGSCPVASSVDPTRSANRTVTSLRSAAGGVTACTGVAQAGQKRASTARLAPHWAQTIAPLSLTSHLAVDRASVLRAGRATVQTDEARAEQSKVKAPGARRSKIRS